MRLPYASHLRASTVLAVLVLAAAPLVPASPVAAETGCLGFANVVAMDSFAVLPGEVRTYAETTAIRAQAVTVAGMLTTADATAGDAPGLCIEAERVSITGVLCTGSGHDGSPAMDPEASEGGDGTHGGDLAIFLQDHASTLALPSLSVAGIVCTGDGGMGGMAFTAAAACLPPEVAVPVDLGLPTCQEPEPCDDCSAVCSLQQEVPVRDVECIDKEPCQEDCGPSACRVLANVGVRDCTVVPPICVPAGVPTVDTGVPSCEDDGCAEDCLPSFCGVLAMLDFRDCTVVPPICSPVALPEDASVPACEGGCVVDCLPVPDPCLPVAAQDVDSGIPTCEGSVCLPDCVPGCGDCDPCDSADCGLPPVNVCDSGVPRRAAGGDGGDGGLFALHLPGPTTPTFAPGSLQLGDGGRGGDALTFGGRGSNTADGGAGGASGMSLNGDDSPPAWLLGALGAGSGGDGGHAMASPLPDCINGGACDPLAQYYTHCLIDGVLDAVCLMYEPQKDAVTSAVPLDACFLINEALGDDPLYGETGESIVVGPGSTGNGNNGADGSSGSAGADFGLSVGADGPSGSATCTGADDAGPGWPGQDGGDADAGHAQGGPGGRGTLMGGKGGNADFTGNKGGTGGKGGNGGDGDVSLACPLVWAAPGPGGYGGKGGASGGGTATGGAGGTSPLQGGAGGDATATAGAPGTGGAGGNGGKGDYYCVPTGPMTSTCTFQDDGAWGCGGTRGAIVTVTAHGGPGGENDAGVKPLNGPPGSPPNGASFPTGPAAPVSYGPHGTGSSNACPM